MNRPLALLSRLALACLCLALLARPAAAHPHVWITAKAELVYGENGMLTAVRHHWTFDEAYSAFATQGLDANHDGKLTPEELAPFAKTSMESLVEFNFFTVVKANGAKQKLGSPRNESMSYDKGLLTLHFEMPVEKPVSGRVVVLEVYDPTFFVDFSPAEGQDAVKLVGAPAGCAINVTRPQPSQAVDPSKLSEAFFQSLTASSTFGSQFGNRAMAACP